MIRENEQRQMVAYLGGLDLTPVPSPNGEGCLLAGLTPSPFGEGWGGVVLASPPWGIAKHTRSEAKW